MSRTQIDDLLHKIRLSCIRHKDASAENCVYYAIAWYIETGRASLEWIKLLEAKKTYKGMISAALRGDTSTSGIIKTINKILNYTVNA